VSERLVVDGLTVEAARPPRADHRPVVFIHGYFADASIFTRWLPFFAERGFPAYAVNLRGRADSRPGTDIGRVSVADFVDDASLVSRSLDRPFVVGHSMGGLIAQKLAERGEAHALALICPAPPRGISVLSRQLVAKQLKYLPALLASRPVRPSAADLKEIVLNRVPPADQDAILARLVPDSGRAGRQMSLTGVPVDERRVRCPVLAMTCDDDRFIPQRVVERVAAKYRAPVHLMARHGHMLPCEPGWEAAAEIIARWAVSVDA